MPIEIKELHIRVAVTTSFRDVAAQADRAAAADNPDAGDAKEAIVAECVEQVLRVLQNRAER